MGRLPFGRRGASGIGFLVILLIFAAALYVGIRLAMPYFAYRDLQGTMKYWGRVCLYRGDSDFRDLRDNIREKIEKYGIPLQDNDVQIEFDPSRKILTVYATYDIEVAFPGYVHHYHFAPYARVQKQEVE
jgi:hypothetical protein